MWFRKKPVVESLDQEKEIDSHKQATKRKVKEVKKANEDLKDLLDENHFTLSIVLALSGKREKRKVG